MIERTDPRVLFAAERTLFAWNRTGISLMAFGFVVERFGFYMQLMGVHSMLGTQRYLSFIGGLGFIMLGAFIEIFSVLQHRHFLGTLHEMDIPVGYNTRAAMIINAVVGFMGMMLSVYIVLGML
jgi:putative membrane protein